MGDRIETDAPGREPAERVLNFIEQVVEADNASGKWGVWSAQDAGRAREPGTLPEGGPPRGEVSRARVGRARVHTRFPPEPNGYLHIGHAKSILLNSGLARTYNGKFNLRFDDTNPAKEEVEYVEAIKRDVKWLGADYENTDWPEGGGGGGCYWASDYFDHMYEYAKELILKGKAYVCELTAEEMAARRGKPGVPATSPFRDRPPDESMRLFREMKAGKHADGKLTLRARIDLASPNFNLRDPVMYRILHEAHHNTGDKWCVYPMYDWAHGLEDSIEGITHSICTLEFAEHKALYDWFIDTINEGRTADGSGSWGTIIHHAQQIEFAKLVPTYTILSKRNLLKMVQEKLVDGWDDPRMPTVAGIRRRGYPAEAVRAFCEEIGVTRFDALIDIGRLENAVRERLNKTAPRYMVVLRPLKVVIENMPEGQVEWLDCVNNPEDAGAGTRKVPFTRELFIERDDFMETPEKKFFRLAPPPLGMEVRLRWAFFVKCVGVVKNAAGEVVELRCTYDPATRGGDAPDGRKVKGTIHWVSATHAKRAEVRLFDRLFKVEEPGKVTGNFLDDLNEKSLKVVEALVEPALAESVWRGEEEPVRVQFERVGYFTLDRDSREGKQVWNRTVGLKDSWGKAGGKG